LEGNVGNKDGCLGKGVSLPKKKEMIIHSNIFSKKKRRRKSSMVERAHNIRYELKSEVETPIKK